MTRADLVVLWLARIAWLSLPLTAGGAIADAVAPWSSPLRLVAAVLAWGGWGVGVLALLIPQPWGLTLLRVAAPCAIVTIGLAATTGRPSSEESVLAVVAGLVAAGLALAPPPALAAVNGPAYGDERRFPLRIPPALFLGPLPGAVIAVGLGVSAGPLLLAAQRWIEGTVAALLGAVSVGVGIRALHGLSRRWAVLVPAGFVLADPASLADPVLFRREGIRTMHAVDERASAPESVADFRLGATGGTVTLQLDTPIDLFTRRGRHDSARVDADEIWFAVVRRSGLLADAARRRIPQRATPPPTTTSPS